MADCLFLHVFPQGLQFVVLLLESDTFGLLLQQDEIIVENPMQIS
jgi:hypothetical protein